MAHGDVSALPQEWVPGVTMPKLVPTERDYTQIRAKFDALGPLAEKLGIPCKGIMLKPGPEVERLARNRGVSSDGVAAGRPLLDTDIRAAVGHHQRAHLHRGLGHAVQAHRHRAGRAQ